MHMLAPCTCLLYLSACCAYLVLSVTDIESTLEACLQDKLKKHHESTSTLLVTDTFALLFHSCLW